MCLRQALVAVKEKGRSLGPAFLRNSNRAQDQNRPSISPLALSLMLLADGTRGRPGMVMISPQMTTMNSAPADSLTSRTGTTWLLGSPFRFGSVEKLYCVLAMQTG